MRNGERKLKIKIHTEKNNIFKKFSPLKLYRIFLLVGAGRKFTNEETSWENNNNSHHHITLAEVVINQCDPLKQVSAGIFFTEEMQSGKTDQVPCFLDSIIPKISSCHFTHMC